MLLSPTQLTLAQKVHCVIKYNVSSCNSLVCDVVVFCD